MEQFRDTAYISIDTMTVIFTDSTVHEVLEHLRLEWASFSDWKQGMSTIGVINDVNSFELNGVRIEVPSPEVRLHFSVGENFKSDLFDFRFTKIRVHLTGHGMTYLRSLYSELSIPQSADVFLFYRFCELKNQGILHFTRIDIAIDFLNQEAPVLQDITSYLLKGGSCTTNGQRLKTDVNVSSRGHTVYLGSKNGSKMLRVYDKYLESTDMDGNWLKNPPFDLPIEEIHSWVRVELQLRARGCPKYLVTDDGRSFLTNPDSYIVDLMSDFYFPKDVVSWYMFFKPFLEGYRTIKLNSHFVQLDSYVTRSVANVDRNMLSILTYIAVYGVEAFVAHCQEYLIHMQLDVSKQFLRWVNLIHGDNYESIYDLPHLERGINGYAVIKSDQFDFLLPESNESN